MKKICILILSILLLPKLQAQEHLQIKTAYDKYAKEKGAVFVQLAKDILSQGNTKISFYKSMVIDESQEKSNLLLALIDTDRTEEYDINKSSSKGKITTLILQIKSGKVEGNEYILYRNTKEKISLVYIRGHFPPDELDHELDKLKDLFIYIKEKKK